MVVGDVKPSGSSLVETYRVFNLAVVGEDRGTNGILLDHPGDYWQCLEFPGRFLPGSCGIGRLNLNARSS